MGGERLAMDALDRAETLRTMLAGRRMNFTRLAAAAGLGRSHVSQVLNGHPGRGGQSRRKLAKVMTEVEKEVMGWGQAGYDI